MEATKFRQLKTVSRLVGKKLKCLNFISIKIFVAFQFKLRSFNVQS